jgi:ATP phosphoribosyltransferase
VTGITIALSKGRIFDETLPLLAAAGIVPLENPETSRKLIIETNKPDVRVVIVRATDVPTYVQYGAADLGVAGKDVLIEHGGEGLYAPLDLKIAKCRMMVAVPEGFDYASAVRQGNRLKVASKYTKTAREHFAAKGVHIDLIKLYGSMELAPLAGLADAIVDLVSTGGTLKANKLVACRAHHGHFIASGRQSGLAEGQARDPATDYRRLCPGGGEVNGGHQASCYGRRRFQGKNGRAARLRGGADENIERTVAGILADVKTRGDAAVVEYSNKFDRLTAASMADLELSKANCRGRSMPAGRAPRRAGSGCRRIKAYHERQPLEGWSYTEADGTMLGQMITPLDRVGLYVPGGKAAYPSSVLMNAIPAKVAGVKELIMVVPTPGGEHNQLVLAAACLAGVDRVFTIGGAQAVGALAYGTHTVPQVDKIVGPGNAYVATRQAPRVRHRRHRHGRRAVGNPRCLRWRESGLGGDGPLSRRPSTTNWRNRS